MDETGALIFALVSMMAAILQHDYVVGRYLVVNDVSCSEGLVHLEGVQLLLSRMRGSGPVAEVVLESPSRDPGPVCLVKG